MKELLVKIPFASGLVFLLFGLAQEKDNLTNIGWWLVVLAFGLALWWVHD